MPWLISIYSSPLKGLINANENLISGSSGLALKAKLHALSRRTRKFINSMVIVLATNERVQHTRLPKTADN